MARILLAETRGQRPALISAAKLIIGVCGNDKPQKLCHANVIEINYDLDAKQWAVATKSSISCAVRILLRTLWANYGAHKLDDDVKRYPRVRPRNITVERDDIDRLMLAAPKHIKLWLLLCSDLAIRSGTAARLGFSNYNAETRELAFTTKYQERVTLPVTEEIRALVEECNPEDSRSFVRQLWHDPRIKAGTPDEHIALALGATTRRLRNRLGMKGFYQHDLRRTTAIALYRQTGDLRDVQQLLGHSSLQSTVWYLAGMMQPVKRSNLELIKRPSWARKVEAA